MEVARLFGADCARAYNAILHTRSNRISVEGFEEHILAELATIERKENTTTGLAKLNEEE